MRILLWNVHGGYSDSLTSGGHEYLYLPPDDQGNGGLPRLAEPAGVNVRQVSAEELRDAPPDVVVLQRLEELYPVTVGSADSTSLFDPENERVRS